MTDLSKYRPRQWQQQQAARRKQRKARLDRCFEKGLFLFFVGLLLAVLVAGWWDLVGRYRTQIRVEQTDITP